MAVVGRAYVDLDVRRTASIARNVPASMFSGRSMLEPRWAMICLTPATDGMILLVTKQPTSQVELKANPHAGESGGT